MLREDGAVRIGTRNLDAKRSQDHRAFIDQASCDLWLLTEVSAAANFSDRNAVR